MWTHSTHTHLFWSAGDLWWETKRALSSHQICIFQIPDLFCVCVCVCRHIKKKKKNTEWLHFPEMLFGSTSKCRQNLLVHWKKMKTRRGHKRRTSSRGPHNQLYANRLALIFQIVFLLQEEWPFWKLAYNVQGFNSFSFFLQPKVEFR